MKIQLTGPKKYRKPVYEDHKWVLNNTIKPVHKEDWWTFEIQTDFIDRWPILSWFLVRLWSRDIKTMAQIDTCRLVFK